MKYFSDLGNDLSTFKTIWLDIDGTIAIDREPEIDQKTVTFIKELSQDKQIFLVSNGRPKEEVKQLAGYLGVNFLVGGKKPNPFILKSVAKFNRKVAVVIGDKLLTDGLWAFLTGQNFIKIKRLVGPKTNWPDRIDDWASNCFFLLKMFRPDQWLKNLLIFAPIIFAHEFLWPEKFFPALGAFIAFSFIAGGVYGINDLFDQSKDQKHPLKSRRPLPAGLISRQVAGWGSGVAFLIGLAISWFINSNLTFLLLGYAVLAFGYSAGLKHWPFVELLLFPIFYLFRIWSGGIATNTTISWWLIMCTVTMSLLIVVGKRRIELSESVERPTLKFYSTQFLDPILLTSGLIAFLAYGFYVWENYSSNLPMAISILLVAGAIGRFISIIKKGQTLAETPEKLVFKDWIIGSLTLAWIALVLTVLYT